MARHNDFGQDSETIARSFLLKKGYSILESNWRSGHKEIDIIAKDGEMLVIVEVKARNVNSPQPPKMLSTNARSATWCVPPTPTSKCTT